MEPRTLALAGAQRLARGLLPRTRIGGSVRLLPLALSSLLAACTPVEPCAETALVDDPILEVGLEDPEGFPGPVQDGARVVPEWGSQGGRHVYLSLHTTGFWPGEDSELGEDLEVPTFEAVLTDDATGQVVTTQQWGWFAMDGDAVDATIALGELFLPEPGGYGSYGTAPEATEPQAVTLTVTGTDRCATTLEAAAAFTLVW
jgi:hypothetical protein